MTTIRARLLHLCNVRDDASPFFSTVSSRDSSSSETMTLNDFLSRSSCFAEEVARLGHDRIAVLSENNVELLFLCVGGWLTGLYAPVLLSFRSKPEEIRRLLSICNCQRIMISERVWQQLGQELPPIPCTILQHLRPPPRSTGTQKQWQERLHTFPLRSDQLAVVLHTSGTTSGQSRFIPLTHGNIVSNQDACLPHLSSFWTSKTHTLAWLPLYHGFGLISEFLHNLWTGAQTTLFISADPFAMPRPHDLLNALVASQATALCCVPWMLDQFAEMISSPPDHQPKSSSSSATTTTITTITSGAPTSDPQDHLPVLDILQKLQFCLVGGAALSGPTCSLFELHRIPVFTVLGITELSGSIMFSKPSNPSQLVLVDGLGGSFQPVPALDTCQLVFARDGAASLYADAEVDKQGEFYTGDLFTPVVSTDTWQSAGRMDAVFKTSTGISVNPEWIEQQLLAEGSIIKRAAVFGRSDLAHLFLCAELSAPHSPTLLWQQVEHVNETSTFAIPQCGVFIVPDTLSLPRTAKGSIDRKALPTFVQLLQDTCPPLSTLLAHREPDITDTKVATLLVVIKALEAAQVFMTNEVQHVLPLSALGLSSLHVDILLHELGLAFPSRTLPSRLALLGGLTALDLRDFLTSSPSASPFFVPESSSSSSSSSTSSAAPSLQSSSSFQPVPLSNTEASLFLKEKLCIESAEEILLTTNRHGLLRDLCRAFLLRVPFQSLTAVADHRPIEARYLPAQSEICEAVFAGQGGQCFVMNVFFGRLLAGLGFNVEFARTSIHRMADAHVTLLVRSLVELNDVWNVDVGCGLVMPEPIRLDALDDESPIYRWGSFRVKYVRQGDRWLRLHDCTSVETLGEVNFTCKAGLRWHLFWEMTCLPQPLPLDGSEEARLYRSTHKIRASVATADGTMLYYKVDPSVGNCPATARKIIDMGGENGLLFVPIATRASLELQLAEHFPAINASIIERALDTVGFF